MSEHSCFFIGTEESTKAFVRNGVSIINNVYSESPIIPRLENSSKRAFKSSAIYSFEVLKKYIEENLNGQPISKAQAVECLGENMRKCYNDMTIFPCDQTIIDDQKSAAKKTNFDYVYVYTDVGISGADRKSKYVDYIVCTVYKVDKNIFDSIIGGDSNNENEDFLQILGYSKGEKYNIEIGFDEGETERQINKYFNNDSEELSDVSDDERAASYIDKKLNKLLSEKDITELYEGLLGKQKGNKKQNPRIVFKKGQHRNDMCCTLWYQDGTVYEKAPLTYFDMCVFDAACTIYNNDRKEFYLNNIWEILSGNEGIRFSRNVLKDKLRESVRNSKG